jgi:hypothetical protein
MTHSATTREVLRESVGGAPAGVSPGPFAPAFAPFAGVYFYSWRGWRVG